MAPTPLPDPLQLVCPVPSVDLTGSPCYITSPYGYRPSTGSLHYGDDWGAQNGIDRGTPVHAPEAGTIAAFGNAFPNAAGKFIWLRGDSGFGWKFFHLDGFASDLVLGRHVAQGQVIGYVGNTGTAAVHLHTQCHDLRAAPTENAGWRDGFAVNVTNLWRAVITLGRWPDLTPPTPPTPPPTEDDMPYNDWPEADRTALATDIAKAISHKTNVPPDTVSTQDLRAYMAAQTNLLAAIAEKLGIQVTWNQGVPIPGDG